MSLTKFDSNFFRGQRTDATMSSFSAFNVGMEPGRLVFASSMAVKDSLGSKLAAKLCLDHFSESVIDCYSDEVVGNESDENIFERSFQKANVAVYEFGHQLTAGGRLAAAIIAMAIEGRRIVTGRVGAMGAYLYRKGRIFPFFLAQESADTCIGINSKVTVETAEVDAKPFDSIFVFSRMLSSEQEQQLARSLGGIQGRVDFDLERVVVELFDDYQSLEFAQVVSIGPETLFLGKEIL